jgi:hypothetical protein
MSLINDALKKAQHRQGDTTPPAAGTPGPARVPGQPSGRPKSPVHGFAIGVIATLLVVAASVAVTVYLLRDDAPPPRNPAPPAASAANAPAASPAPLAAPSTPAPLPATAPAIPATTSAPAPVAPPVAVTPATATPPPPPAEPTIPTLKLGTRIQSFVDRLRVTSIRISDTGNKAILNDRLFRVNDLVEPALGLRLTDIQPHLLTFTDENGATYLRHF